MVVQLPVTSRFWSSVRPMAGSTTSATTAAAFTSLRRWLGWPSAGRKNRITLKSRKMDSYGRVSRWIARPRPSQTASRVRGWWRSLGSAPNTRQPAVAATAPPQ